MTTPTPPSASSSQPAGRRRLLTVIVVLVAALIALPSIVIALHAKAMRGLLESTPTPDVAHRVAAARPMFAYAPAVDTTITPAAAGAALWASQSTISRISDAVYPQRESAPFVPLPTLEASDAPFRDIVASEASAPDPAQVIARARRGFTPAERAWLRDLAANPVWTHYAVVARAGSVDPIAGRLVLPLPEGADPYQLPIIRFSEMRTLAVANASRVALLLSEGRRAEAELAASEPFGVARALSRGTFLIEVLVGTTFVRGAPRVALEELFRATADPRLGSMPTVEPTTQAVSKGIVGFAERIAAIRDTSRLTAERLEDLALVPLLECGSVSGILFGRETEVSALFAYARDSIARSDGERELVRIIEELPGSRASGRSAAGLSAAARVVDLAGRMSGNQRMRGCAFTMALLQ